MQGRGALWVFAASDILRDNFLHLLLLPPCPQFKYFPILNLQSPLPTGGVAIMGHSMVETVSIIQRRQRRRARGGDWRCQRQQCRPILSTGLALICSTFWPPPKYLLCFDTFILWFCFFLAIFLKLAQIICPPPHLCLSPPGYEHSNQFYLHDCSPVPQQSAPEIQPFLYQIANCLPQQTGPLKNYVKNSIYWGFWEKRVKKGPSLSFLDCDLQRADMNVKVTVVLLNVQRRRSPQPHQKLIFVATTDCRTNLPPRTGNPQYYSRYIRFKKNHCNPLPLEYSMWPL